MRLHIGGHYWKYSAPRRISWDGEEIEGLCIEAPCREIRVIRRIKGQRKAEVQLHELCHAAHFSAHEVWVTTFAGSATALCYLAGCGLAKHREQPSGADIIRRVLFNALRISRTDLDNDQLLQDWADDLTRALGRLGSRHLAKK